MTKNHSRIAFLLITLALVHSAHALNVQLFRPNDTVESSVSNLGIDLSIPQQTQVGFVVNWVKNPIEFGSASNSAKIDDVVNWILTTDVIFSHAITDRFGLQVDIPVHWAADVENILTVVNDKRIALGDIRANFPIMLRKNKLDERNQLGITLIPFMTAPTGKSSDFLGDTNWTGGSWLEFDRYFGKRHRLIFSSGVRFREKENILNLTIGHEVLANLGYVWKFSVQKGWDFFANLQGSTTTSKFLDQEISSPYELTGGLRKRWKNDQWNVLIGAGRGMNNGYGAPDIRTFAGLSYRFLPKKAPQPAAPVPPPAPVAVEPTPTPAPVPVVVEAPKPIESIDLIGKVLFAFDKATILPESYPILDNVVDVLQRHAEVSKVEIQAHTDAKGNDDYNMQLSVRRAEAVRKYLVDKGVAADRLEAKGYGESKPIASNDTQEGRDQNRRVEFVILQQKTNP